MTPLPRSSFETMLLLTVGVTALVYLGNLRLEAVAATLDVAARMIAARLGIEL